MPRPTLRTRSEKRKYRSVPGGRRKALHKEEKAGSPKCFNCGCNLNFLPSSTRKIRKLPKNQKRVSRMYGGELCHSCLRALLKQASRKL